jgi:uncharacterized protein YggE
MRHAAGLALGLAIALLLLTTAAGAADGVRATATASRDVPADVMAITVQVGERAAPGALTDSPQAILAKALETKGWKLLERGTRNMSIAGAFGTRSYNVISSAGDLSDAVEVQKQLVLRVTGYKRLDDVLELLARHGVREKLTIGVDHSNAAAVRQELEKEAIGKAIEQARIWANHAGVKTGRVLDLSVQSVPSTASGMTTITAGSMTWVPGGAVDTTLSDPEQSGELPRLKLSATATVTLAITPE